MHYSEMRTACPTQERDTSPRMVSCALCCSHLVRNPTWFHSAPPNLNMYIKPESFLLSFISTLNIFNKCFSSSQACSCPSLRAPSYKLQKLLAEWRERNKAFEQTVQILVHSLGCWLSAKEWRNWGCSWLLIGSRILSLSPQKEKNNNNWNKERHAIKHEFSGTGHQDLAVPDTWSLF